MRWMDPKGRLFGKVSLLDIGAGFLFLLIGGTVSYGVQIAGHNTLQLFNVEPPQIVAGQTPSLQINGSNFRGASRGNLVPYPMTGLHYINHVRADYPLSKEIPSGQWTLVLETHEGQLAWIHNALEVIWQPEIDRVTPTQLVRGKEVELIIEGNYFEPGFTLLIGPWILDAEKLRELEYRHTITPHRIQVYNFAIQLPPGRYPVGVINPDGRKAVLANAIEVAQHRPASLMVTCSVEVPTPEVLQRIRLRKSFDSWRWNGGKVLDVSVPEFERRIQGGNIAILHLLLEGEAETFEDQIRYFYLDQEIKPGAQIQLFLHGAGPKGSPFSVTGLVLSSPQVVSDSAQNLSSSGR